jgi:hypothetical protein
MDAAATGVPFVLAVTDASGLAFEAEEQTNSETRTVFE